MLIDLKQETADDIFKKILIEDWSRLKQEVKEYKENENLLPHQQEDFNYSKKLKKAYERIIRYICTSDEADEIIGKKEK